ncbi:hypothetical protein KSF78_0006262 [Schistosoma japonicum]|nr:hypothetical protein KSF78_0006262 [Schistosoma japonicum]
MLRCTPTPCYMHRCKLLIRKQSEYIEMMHSKKRFTNSQEVVKSFISTIPEYCWCPRLRLKRIYLLTSSSVVRML